jgi:hypothetical protein
MLELTDAYTPDYYFNDWKKNYVHLFLLYKILNDTLYLVSLVSKKRTNRLNPDLSFYWRISIFVFYNHCLHENISKNKRQHYFMLQSAFRAFTVIIYTML